MQRHVCWAAGRCSPPPPPHNRSITTLSFPHMSSLVRVLTRRARASIAAHTVHLHLFQPLLEHVQPVRCNGPCPTIPLARDGEPSAGHACDPHHGLTALSAAGAFCCAGSLRLPRHRPTLYSIPTSVLARRLIIGGSATSSLVVCQCVWWSHRGGFQPARSAGPRALQLDSIVFYIPY